MNLENENILAQKFKFSTLIKYTMPTIAMMIFMSTYQIIDGIFVANLVGENALSAVNLVVPVFGIIMAISLMFGTGGVAIIGKYMGENQYHKARGFLSTIYVIGFILGLVITTVGIIFRNEFVSMLGASDLLEPYAYDYFMCIVPFATSMALEVFVQTFFVAAGKPGLGFGACVCGGITNIVLDYVFISPDLLDLGISGAGLATGLSATVPGIFGLLYFTFKRNGTLYFEKPDFHIKDIIQCMYNGSSEMVSNLSYAVTTFLFNLVMLKLIGPNGVAAISVILYVQMFQMALYIGYSMGVAPIISYKFGEQNHTQLSVVIRTSIKILCGISGFVVLLSILFSDIAVGIFIARDSDTFGLAKDGFIIFSFAYFFMGVNVFMSAMFTALSNGKVSAGLSMCRTLVLTVLFILFLPKILGTTGVWLAVPAAELCALFISFYFYIKYKSIYRY